MKRAASRPLIPLLVLTILGTGADARAGDHAWTTSGPFHGGEAAALAIDPRGPTTMFAGMVAGGLYRSTDGAASWHKVGFSDASVRGIAIDPATPSTVYAGTTTWGGLGGDGGIFKSTDGGTTWVAMNAGLTDLGIQALAIAPSEPSVLYHASSDGTLKSTDGGASWRRVHPNGLVGVIVVDPTSSDVVYLGSLTEGVLRSTDGGQTWTRTNNGLPGPATTIAMDARTDPSAPPTLYAAFSFFGNGGGAYRSTDGGDHWSLAGLAAYYVDRVTADPTRPGTGYASTHGDGVFKTTDGGGTWASVLPSSNDVATAPVVVDPTGGDTLLVATRGWILRSDDGGASWARRSDGIGALFIRGIAFDAGSADEIYAVAAPGGAFRSSDGGASWRISGAGVVGSYVSDVATDPATPGVAYVGVAYDGVFKTTDGGASWSPARNGLPSHPCATIHDIAVAPSHPATLYAATANCMSYAIGVYRSTDAGASWTDVGGPDNVACVAVHPSDPEIVLAAAAEGIYRSTDSGASWLQVHPESVTPFVELAFDPAAPAMVYALSWGSLLGSSDGGASWSTIDTDGDLMSFAIDPSRPSTLYLGTGGSGVLRSTDAGATWSPRNRGLGSYFVSDLAIDPRRGSTLVAGTVGASTWSLTSGADAIVAGPGPGPANENRARLLAPDGSLRQDWIAYAAGTAGTEVAGGNIDAGDDELLTGPGPGEQLGPQVRAFREDATTVPKVDFYAYATLRYGVLPAAGDVDGDGHAEILAGAGPGGVFGPHVRGFDYDGVALTPIARIGFFAYATPRYGVNVATADLDGDGSAELLTGPGPGVSFAPHLRGFDDDGIAVRAIARLSANVWSAPGHGLRVASGDVDGDGRAEGIFGPGPGPALDASVRGLALDAGPPRLLPGIDQVVYAGLGHGLEPGAADLDDDGDDELLCGQGPAPAAASHLRSFDYAGGALVPLATPDLDVFGASFGYGVNVAAAATGD